MKTLNSNKLDFIKNTIVELNDEKMQDVKGGIPTITTYICTVAYSISIIIATRQAEQ